ncbi:beta-1,3-galactosyltransferase 5-like [Mercenaria mercenaria]|uniref:beta-1,3-galactosyltransferase 5-like n=1 Tax=Mercenaria mercenaria TaxID=6596 RepID=UPI001E1E1B52|nr:beta-1,3-galactosyltransferase 5-like [Mercenaria mercenaria]XP_045202899.1 beta-1,3-galactosyltransferase 5-like [Mercenaria mercenaria]XP_045202900.1 beta-1,3-galactosyltransferase 5-like [Mercenaria mercenaria]
MIPRHPLILKITTVCATILLICLLFYRRETSVIIQRSVVVTIEPMFDEKEFENLESEDQTTTTTTELPSTTRKQVFVNGDGLEFLINQQMCSKDRYLVIYVHSGPEHSERRRVIRNTWASLEILKKHKAKLVFVMGEVEDENLQATLETESELYKDIIQGNFTDAYRNLTYKAIAGLKWVTENCPGAVYVLKTDDDIIVDIHRIVRLMRSYIEHKWGKQNILAGYIWTHMNVDRNKSSKWYTSDEEFPEKFFLKYCSGSAYIMSYDVVKKFYLKSHEIPFFWVDDYYVTGMLAHATNVTPTSLNDRYILENKSNILGALKNDTKTRLVFVHSPDTNTSVKVWKNYLDRW